MIDYALFPPLPKYGNRLTSHRTPRPASTQQHPAVSFKGCLFDGWILDPSLFGSPTRLGFTDGSGITPEPPTTAMEAYDTFRFVIIGLDLATGIHLERFSGCPWFAYMAEPSKPLGDIPSVISLQELEEYWIYRARLNRSWPGVGPLRKPKLSRRNGWNLNPKSIFLSGVIICICFFVHVLSIPSLISETLQIEDNLGKLRAGGPPNGLEV
ncbi:hypothetical protein B0H12DRAFT_1067106 [Mycena haematopus]|nr:hypothetical protein B0H12DRAFT_1067106 [Mycena haematopus]